MGTGISGAGDITWIQWDAMKRAINEYVKNQLQEDIVADQISIREYTDPFTGEPVNKGK